MNNGVWEECRRRLQSEVDASLFNTWIRPLEYSEESSDAVLVLVAPNRFVSKWVESRFLRAIEDVARETYNSPNVSVSISHQAGGGRKAAAASKPRAAVAPAPQPAPQPVVEPVRPAQVEPVRAPEPAPAPVIDVMPEPSLAEHDLSSGLSAAGQVPEGFSTAANAHNPAQEYIDPSSFDLSEANQAALPFGDTLYRRTAPAAPSEPSAAIDSQFVHSESSPNPNYRFDNFVTAPTNEVAFAAAMQVARGGSNHEYNPLLIHGMSGLGKSHLMNAIGNEVLRQDPNAKVLFVNTERFINDFIRALQSNLTQSFKKFYRSQDFLLFDDIQFLANKKATMEEFFHMFNSITNLGQRLVMTSDKHPRSIEGLDSRLKSRVSWGTALEIQAPDIETRVAILRQKASETGFALSEDVALFVAQNLANANGRDLEGAVKTMRAHFYIRRGTVDILFAKEALKEAIKAHKDHFTIDKIQTVVADFYKLKLSDMVSKRRTRSIARPRQIAMALSKELTKHSLPEIGRAFGGRDHTTVLHACRKIKELSESDKDVRSDYERLTRILSE